MRISDDLRPEERDILQRIGHLPIDFEALAVVSNIWRAAQGLKLKMERGLLRENQLTWGTFATLFIVWIWGPAETREIARLQGVTRPTVTSNVSALERRGLCVRQTSDEDKRLVSVALTPQGRKTIERLFLKFNEGEQEIASALTAAERATIARLLRKVVAGLSAASNQNGQRV
jgi:DNA-binding MarR family transcriptional regulator